MSKMHSICFDSQNNLVVKYEPTNEYDKDYDMKDFLSEAGFEKIHDSYVFKKKDEPLKILKVIQWTVEKFDRMFGIENVDVCDPVKNTYKSSRDNQDSYQIALNKGAQIKKSTIHEPRVSSQFKRSLMDYQKQSVEHIIEIGNAANFSVPGSGKTTITYAAISRWLEDKTIDKIFVIGPTASFLPWEEEYQECFGRPPRSCRISGDIAREIHNLGESYDLFLAHFNTAMNRVWEISTFMQKWNTVLIVDESHNIKSPNLRRWATSALALAPYAKRRIILSGTPMPNSAEDLWTQITFLWPQNAPLGNQLIYNQYVKKRGIGRYSDTLDRLFCRITKNDLNLPRPQWIPHTVKLNTRQREIYDVIAAKTLREIDEMSIQEQARLQKFRIARMIRLLQTASNPSLLYEMSGEFDVNSETFSEEFGLPPSKIKLPGIEPTLYDKIVNYSKFEIPTKMIKASQIARDLFDHGKKVIIWSSFILNMSIFKEQLLKDLNPIIINGTVPKETTEHGNRDEMINDFKNSKEPRILIATAASLGESISLHRNLNHEKVSEHAIYLDRNFNAGQYMQSMDRIHRIGMDPTSRVEYHLIIGENTIDEVINRRLNEKWEQMLDTLNDDMLHSLNIDPEPERINDVEFNLDYQATVEHLRRLSHNR